MSLKSHRCWEVGFGYGSVSLSHDELIAASDEVQQLFDEGKTVMRTVLSFRHRLLLCGTRYCS